MATLPAGITFGNEDEYLPGEERSSLQPLPDDAQALVDVGIPSLRAMEEGALVQEMPGGEVVVDLEPGAQGQQDPAQPVAFGDNLAEGMDDGELAQIAALIIEEVDADLKSRSQWHERLADGLTILGVVTDKDSKSPFKQAEAVNHPVISEAIVQFQARASAELLPPTGPAKGLVLGDKTEELEEQAERVADYQNYQLMVEDPDYFPETEKMYFTLSANGSQFKKIYRDHLLEQNVSRWVRGEDFIVPYGATTLRGAQRYTHQIVVERNDMRKLQAAGVYRKVDLATPSEGPTRPDKVAEAKDKAQGQENASALMLDDMPHTVFEAYRALDLKGFEDVDESGEPTGIGRPYIVTVDKESRTVIGIRRNWKESDPKRRRRVNFVHYPYLPGEGFYSYGLIHFLGGAGAAATGLLRIIILGAAFAAMQGGFKTKDAKVPSDLQLEWGVYKDVEMTAEELSRCFWTPDFKQPNESLFKVLGLITEAVQRFGSTTESMVGDANNTGPVGTTVALIEQGSKVFSGIHRRLHFAQGEELRLLAELNGEYIPAEGYPYAVAGGDRMIYQADFSDAVDVVPVSDPNIFSSTQRIAIAQSLVQRSTEAPDMYDRRKVEKYFLQSMRVPDADDFLVDPSKVQRCDPVTENALLLVGRPVKVFQDQHHDAHITLHMDQINRLTAEQNPMAERVVPATLSHVAEHMAYSMRSKMAAAMGITLPPVDLSVFAEPGKQQALPPEVENQIAQRAAMAIAQMPVPQSGQQQAEAQAGLEEQAAGMEKEAAAIAQEREALKAEKNEVARSKLEQKHAQRESQLRERVATIQQQAKGDKQAANVKAIVEQAVQRVEAALKGKP